MKLTLTKKPLEIIEYCLENGEEDTLTKYDIKPATLKRYMAESNRLHQKISAPEYEMHINDEMVEEDEPVSIESKKEKLLTEIATKYSLKELQAISKGYDPTSNNSDKLKLNLKGNRIKIGVISDTHIGSKSFMESWWDTALSTFESENVEFICHVGDLVEGLSDRKGHWYDLTHIGYEPQRKYAIDLLSRTDIPIYGIDGNHDRWYIKSANALICKDISEIVPNYTFLGSDEADIYLNDKVYIKLWHGEDGSSYATSYRIQKILESLESHELPSVLLLGHVHKSAYLPGERDVYSFSAGALCKQSKWMRSKKLANHAGFWIIDINYNDDQVLSCKGEFFRFSSPQKEKHYIE